MWTPIKYTTIDRVSFSVQVQNPEDDRTYWVDIYIDEKYHDVEADWNQYIFFKEDPEDEIRKETQADNNNFDDATGVAICFLEQEGVIYQDDEANWFVKE